MRAEYSIQSTDVTRSVAGRSPPSQNGNHALRYTYIAERVTPFVQLCIGAPSTRNRTEPVVHSIA